MRDGATYERAGSGFDPGARGYELQGREAPKVELLPDDQIKVQRQSDGRLLVNAQSKGGYREWQFYELSKV